MTVGDLYWVESPAGAGHAQGGRRPAIIFQGEDANGVPPTVLIIPLTTQRDALRFPATFLIEMDSRNNLRRNSVALIFQLTALDKRLIREWIGEMSLDVITRVWEELYYLAERFPNGD